MDNLHQLGFPRCSWFSIWRWKGKSWDRDHESCEFSVDVAVDGEVAGGLDDGAFVGLLMKVADDQGLPRNVAAFTPISKWYSFG